MNYEEKYKNALERAREVYTYYCDDTEQLRKIESIFPELKESEDEMIKNEIKLILANTDFSQFALDYTFADMLFWLEKQGEKKPIINVPSREVILSIWDLGNEWKELTNGCTSTEYGTQLDYIQKHWYESEYYLREKQGEKPQGKTALEAIKEEKIDDSNKVEPKFKEGDYIKHNKANLICKVVSVNNGSYFVDNIKTNCRIELFNAEQNFHLWTIQDAKDGDVLFEGSCIFIIQKLGDNGTAAKVYWALYTLYNDGDFDIDSILYFDIDSTKPATKDQRDLLFQKMEEAGYKWDATKKELIKIEKN